MYVERAMYSLRMSFCTVPRRSRRGAPRPPALADLAADEWGVRVVAHLRREVERHTEARGAVVEEVPEPPVRLLGRPIAGVLAHRPQAPAVHRRGWAAGEGGLAGEPEVAVVVEVLDFERRVQELQRRPAEGPRVRRRLRGRGGCGLPSAGGGDGYPGTGGTSRPTPSAPLSPRRPG